VSIDALPVILPVNYAIDGGAIVFRTTPGTKLSAALLETVVAFEVDEYEPNGDVGWSVLVQGVATEVVADDQIAWARQLPLRLISAGGDADRFVHIEIARVTGRRLRP
jgi:nitroimidazol reductase NimA-like FMN-containing flavoprotein (pyridoxamine 5'-phosphate oxidase superfamily)